MHYKDLLLLSIFATTSSLQATIEHDLSQLYQQLMTLNYAVVPSVQAATASVPTAPQDIQDEEVVKKLQAIRRLVMHDQADPQNIIPLINELLHDYLVAVQVNDGNKVNAIHMAFYTMYCYWPSENDNLASLRQYLAKQGFDQPTTNCKVFDYFTDKIASMTKTANLDMLGMLKRSLVALQHSVYIDNHCSTFKNKIGATVGIVETAERKREAASAANNPNA